MKYVSNRRTSTSLVLFRYSFTSNNESVPFWVDEMYGYLRLKDWVDYEAKTFYKFGVKAEVDTLI